MVMEPTDMTPHTPASPAHAPVLWREISWVMLFKLAALTLLWYLFFGPTHRVIVTPERVQQRLFAPGPGTPLPAHDGDHPHA
jgi:hypothetical protein